MKGAPHTAFSLLFRRCHKGGRGGKQGFLALRAPPPSPSPSALLSSSLSFLSRSSHSDASLCASSSAGAGTSLPTSVVDRKSSTAPLHLSSASRSRTLQRLFHLPVSFLTSAHKIFCCSFHSAHSLKRWSRVCVPPAHHQHSGEGRRFVQYRCCPVRQWPVFSW